MFSSGVVVFASHSVELLNSRGKPDTPLHKTRSKTLTGRGLCCVFECCRRLFSGASELRRETGQNPIKTRTGRRSCPCPPRRARVHLRRLHGVPDEGEAEGPRLAQHLWPRGLENVSREVCGAPSMHPKMSGRASVLNKRSPRSSREKIHLVQVTASVADSPSLVYWSTGLL